MGIEATPLMAAALSGGPQALPINVLFGLPDDGTARVVVSEDGRGLDFALPGTASIATSISSERFDARLVYVQPGQRRPIRLGPGALINHAADADLCSHSLRVIAQIVRRSGRPCFNHPAAVLQTSRDAVSRRLADIPGLQVPKTIRVQPGSLDELRTAIAEAGLTYPVLVRPAGSHKGVGMVRVESAKAMSAAAPLLGGQALYATEFRDFASPDGRYRKYRIALVGDAIFLRHVVIGQAWLLHAGSRSANTVAEEEAALAAFPTGLGLALRPLLLEVGRRLELDYVGIDCSISETGEVLLFEANACMNLLENTQPSPNMWDRVIAEIAAALEERLAAPITWRHFDVRRHALMAAAPAPIARPAATVPAAAAAAPNPQEGAAAAEAACAPLNAKAAGRKRKPINILFGLPDDSRARIFLAEDGDRIDFALPGTLGLLPYLSLESFEAKMVYLQPGRWTPVTLGPGPLINHTADPDLCGRAVRAMVQICSTVERACFNHPTAIAGTTRERVARVLTGIPGLTVPKTIRVAGRAPAELRQAIADAGLAYPLLIRVAGSHMGQNSLRATAPDEIDQIVQLGGEPLPLYATELVDFVSRDGHYRKHRVVVVGDELFLHHMIVGDSWLLHWDRRVRGTEAEESALLNSFDTDWAERLRPLFLEIGRRLDLDYFGVDCHIAPSGEVLLFEANACMNNLEDAKPLPNMWQAPFARLKTALETHLANPAKWRHSA
jgi:glutathione synthase/RimK-type ligase-like ATP-grasp enzyme